MLTGKYEGKKADIWSCGIILFVMLSGCHPFDGETVNDLFKRIENLEFKYPTYFSSEARALLDKIIVVDPDCRASIEDIRTDVYPTEHLRVVMVFSSVDSAMMNTPERRAKRGVCAMGTSCLA